MAMIIIIIIIVTILESSSLFRSHTCGGAPPNVPGPPCTSSFDVAASYDDDEEVSSGRSDISDINYASREPRTSAYASPLERKFVASCETDICESDIAVARAASRHVHILVRYGMLGALGGLSVQVGGVHQPPYHHHRYRHHSPPPSSYP